MSSEPDAKPIPKSAADTQPLKLPAELREDPTERTTGKFSSEEIQARLGAARTEIQATPEGSSLRIIHAHAPPEERRSPLRPSSAPPEGMDRRRFTPLQVPTLFPTSGTILVLLIGGFADDRAMGEAAPFWKDDLDGGSLVWQALSRAGLVEREDLGAALGQGGFWEDAAPRTASVAMTYIGYRRRGESADFEQVIKGWNQRRLQVLIQECDRRSQGRLRVVSLGEAARFMTSACMFGLPGIPLLALPDPTRDALGGTRQPDPPARDRWIEWAADVLQVKAD